MASLYDWPDDDFDWTSAPIMQEELNANAEEVSEIVKESTSIELELFRIEADILKLFASKPFPVNKLDEKISELLQLVDYIPPDYPNSVEMFKVWSQKADAFMEKYSDSNSSFKIVDSQKNISPDNSLVPMSTEFTFILRKKLEMIELEITQMLAEKSDPNDVQKKISVMAEIVDRIPVEFADLWVNKLANFLQAKEEQVGQLSVYNRASSIEELRRCLLDDSVSTNQSPTDDFTLQIPQSNHGDNFKSTPENSNTYFPKDQTGCSYENYNNNNTLKPIENTAANYQQYDENVFNENPTNEQENTSPSLCEVAQQILSKIKPAFDCFRPLRDVTDVRGLRILLPLVGKARKVIDAYDGDRCTLYSEVLSLVQSKLPDDWQWMIGEQNNSLFGLIKSLSDQLCTIMEEARSIRESNELELLFHCSFCKVDGHSNYNCARIKAMFCFKCFRFGHLQRRCTSNEVRVEDIWF